MRRLAVSDIHGEGSRLLQALHAAAYDSAHDRLFLLGDYMDRGTDARLTVAIIQNLVADGAVALCGNHDLMPGIVVRAHTHLPWWVDNGGDATIRSFRGLPPLEVIAWLDRLPLYHEEPDCILVHAGLTPGVALAEQDPVHLLWIREEFVNHYRGKRVIFGHTPTVYLHGTWAPWAGDDKLGIDTGAAVGGLLTVVDIDSLETWTA
ncbi:MAG TPA: metallophosphoesterase [Symbiobacteriaceae bacterium]